MSFIKKISYLVLSFVLFSMTMTALAQNTEVVSKMEPVDCFAPGLYKFQSVQVSVGPERQSYTAGDIIKFTGSVINQNDYPVVDGNVFVRISKVNPNYITDGHYVVDEIMPVVNVSIDASSSLPVNFSWKVPKDLGKGDYRADFFFSVGEKFNLGGLPFTNEIIVGFSNFKITNTINTEFVLDRVNTKVNGEKYNHIGNWPFIKQGEEIKIIQPVKNLTNKEIKVAVSYDLYFWDSLNIKDKLDSKIETVTVPANSSKNLIYIIPKSAQSVYYLKIRATSGDASSIVNIRTTSDIEKARINYPAITTFPLTKDESVNLFSCFHTINGVASSGRLVITLTDKDGDNILKSEYNGSFGINMSAASTKFTPGKDYRFVNLKAELFDNGKLTDSYETQYDCSTLKSNKCDAVLEKFVDKNVLLYSLVLVLIALLGLLIIPKYAKNSVLRKIFIGIFILLLVLSVIVLILVFVVGVDKIFAENVSIDGKTKTETRSSGYDIGRDWSAADCRRLASGDISYTHEVVLTGSSTLSVGQSISFSNSGSCTYSANGGAWDTPNCGTSMSINDQASNRVGTINWSDPAKPGFTLTSSNNSVISCSGSSCTAIGPGNANVTVNVSGVSTAFSMTFTDNSGTYNDTDSSGVGAGIGMSNGQTCTTDGRPHYTANSQTINLSGYSPVWSFTVANPGGPSGNTLTASCYGTPNPAIVGQTSVSWIATSTGGTGSYTYDWSGTDGLTGASSSVTKTYTATGTKQASVLVTSGSATTSIACFGSIVSGGTPGNGGCVGSCGVNITDSKINGDCVKNGAYEVAPVQPYLCLAGTPSAFSGTGPWTWNCLGSGTNHTDAIGCSAAKTPTPTYNPALDCSVGMTNPVSSPVNVNINTTWVASTNPTCPSCIKSWTLTDSNNPSGTPIIVSDNKSPTLDKIFTTVGAKTISVRFSTTTTVRSWDYNGNTIYTEENYAGNPCTASVNIVQEGGSIRER